MGDIMRKYALIVTVIFSMPISAQEVTFQLRDGSVIQSKLPKEAVDFRTPHGLLKIEPAYWRLFDLGLFCDVDEDPMYKAMVKKLGDEDYSTRQHYHDKLFKDKFAIRHLLEGLTSKDEEVVLRCKSLLKSVPYEVGEDVFHDGSQRIHGRIENKTFEIESTFFSCKIPRKSVKKIIAYPGDFSFKLGSFATWVDTNYYVFPGLKITSVGEIDLWPPAPGTYKSNADGHATYKLGGKAYGTLYGRVNGTEFKIGSNFEIPQGVLGNLQLYIVTTEWQVVPTGNYEISIRK